MGTDSGDDLHICLTCALAPALKALATHVDPPATCVLCRATSGEAIDINLRRTHEVFRALLRFYFNEWAYNHHLGGDEIEQVLSRPNSLIDHSNGDGVEEICLCVYRQGYETTDVGISLFAGYCEGEQNRPLEALATSEDGLLRKIRRRLQTENHFHLAKELDARLQSLRRHIEKDLHGGTYTRARIGIEKRAVHRETWQPAYVPYSGDSLMAPPPPLATPGRINRGGVAFLYVASDTPTAVAEVRPHPGHLVSTGTIRQRQRCTIADFSEVRLADFASSDDGLDAFGFLRTVERDFAAPVVPEDRTRYSLGQLVADVLREMGFSGLAYRSSVSRGINFCFFEPTTFEYVEGSGSVVSVQGLQYETVGVAAIPRLSKAYREA